MKLSSSDLTIWLFLGGMSLLAQPMVPVLNSGQQRDNIHGPGITDSNDRGAPTVAGPQSTLGPTASQIYRQAVADFRAGRTVQARAHLKQGLEIYPDDPPLLHLAGLVLSELGENQAAQTYFERAVKLWPDHPVYWINLGIFYLRISRIPDAEAALMRSVAISPNPAAYNLLGIIRLDQNAGEQAVDFLKKSLDLNRREVRSWYYLGLAHQSLAQNDAAYSCYQEALRLAPRDSYTCFQLGKLLLQRGQRSDALKYLKDARQNRSDEPELCRLISEAYLGMGDAESALKWGKRAAEIDPDNAQVHYQLGMVLARMGQREESASEFRRSEELPKKAEPSPLDRWRQINLRASNTQ